MLILKALFCISGILYIPSIILHKAYISKLKDNVKISNYVAFVAFLLLVYILSGLVLVIFLKGLLNKIIILFFATCPFIIGKIATYKKEIFFTLLQFILMFISAIFILLL